MPESRGIDDTIVAIATPPGIGGIGVIRFSGPASLDIVARMFRGRGRRTPSDWKSHTIHLGHIVDQDAGGGIVDEVLVTVMRSPRSYTCEDVVEISCHGGPAPVRSILNLAIRHGARLAEPGEFTKRAFLNGRIDLAQAEAVQDIIQAATDTFLKVSVNQLKGDLTRELELIRHDLMDIYTQLEAAVNFPEERLETLDRQQIGSLISASGDRIAALRETGRQGRLLKEGIRVAICGKANVGKSSLLNVLVREPRAIVTPVAGTTRDTIEEVISIQGVPFRLVDTAGILEPRDVVEQEAVKRSRGAVESADLILFMLDADRGFLPQDNELLKLTREKTMLVVINKCDLKVNAAVDEIQTHLPGREMIHVSALKEMAINELRDAMARICLQGKALNVDRVLVNNVRHLEALQRCGDYVKQARESLSRELPPEFVSEDIHRAVDELDRITGRRADQDLLQQIFATFCVGK